MLDSWADVLAGIVVWLVVIGVAALLVAIGHILTVVL